MEHLLQEPNVSFTIELVETVEEELHITIDLSSVRFINLKEFVTNSKDFTYTNKVEKLLRHYLHEKVKKKKTSTSSLKSFIENNFVLSGRLLNQ